VRSVSSRVRIVSLVPSVTETLTAWGIEPIGCTRFCERPDLVEVGGTKNPDLAAIVELRPDIVVVDRQENRREDAEMLAASAVTVVDLDVRSLDGLDEQLALLAAAAGVEPARLDLPRPVDGPRVRAFVPIWRRPWMTIGASTYGSSLLSHLGVDNVFADAATDYPTVDLDDVRGRSVDVVLAPSEPYAFTDVHVAELTGIAPVIRVDGQDLFWWGARTPDAITRLAAAVSEPPRAAGSHHG
jgi:ABC-type Fe3+-hydroxamate transport system substrate-binding protein